MKVSIMITVVVIIAAFTVSSFFATKFILKHRISKLCVAHPDNEDEVQKLAALKLDFVTKSKKLALLTMYRDTYNVLHANNTLAAISQPFS